MNDKYYSILQMKEVEMMLSSGVSILGTLYFYLP